MQVQVKKWDDSASVRLPSAILQAADLKLDQMVDIREEGGRIIIEPIVSDPSLDDLLDQITVENLHAEVVNDTAVGAEVW